ncbi:MAG: glycosyltransferase [Acidimicrobiaceae bacterium]|nr:glycosyltransferase [Acidimicrobiaceae bacterium]
MLVMAKSPIPGSVKTRLCPPWTLREAAAVARAALEDTLEAALASSAERVLLCLAGPSGPWIPADVEVFAQHGSTFAERLQHAWTRAGGPGIQIGMDTPQVTGALLDRCLERVLDGDPKTAGLGPARDGGWWSLALWRPIAGMFAGVPMSGDDTGAAQRARLEELGFSLVELPTLTDVDRFDDAVALAQEIPRTRFGALVEALSPLGSRRETLLGGAR